MNNTQQKIDNNREMARQALNDAIGALHRFLDLQRDLEDSLIDTEAWKDAHAKSMKMFHQIQDMMNIAKEI